MIACCTRVTCFAVWRLMCWMPGSTTCRAPGEWPSETASGLLLLGEAQSSGSLWKWRLLKILSGLFSLLADIEHDPEHFCSSVLWPGALLSWFSLHGLSLLQCLRCFSDVRTLFLRCWMVASSLLVHSLAIWNTRKIKLVLKLFTSLSQNTLPF